VNGQKHIFCVEAKAKNSPYLLNPSTFEKLNVAKKETVKRWDYISTFKPP
jgi:hypothetical protein